MSGIMIPPPPISTLFPYTTLFRSVGARRRGAPSAAGARELRAGRPARRNIGGHEGGGLRRGDRRGRHAALVDRKSTRLNSSHVEISYAVFCLKKKTRRYRRLTVSR